MRLRCIILLSGFWVFLSGDVMYEMVTTTEGMMGMGGGETKTRVFIKDDLQRTEIASENEMRGETQTILITRFDKGVMWTLDPENKQYTEIKIDEGIGIEEVEHGEEGRELVMPEIKVERTGKKKVLLDKECEEVVVSMMVEDDEGSMTFAQTMWVTKDMPGYEEISDMSEKMTALGLKSSQQGMMEDQKLAEEFQRKIEDIEGFPLEFTMDITMATEDMSFSIKTHSVVTKLDKKPIDHRVFEIPKGYTRKD